MGRYSVKRYKTKRRTRDLDLIFNDLSDAKTIQSLKQQPEDEFRPGLGQYYCLPCDRYFQDNKALKTHLKHKVHKRRVKDLSVNPYTNLEAEAASGTNLEKYISSVEKYKKEEPTRKEMADELLKTQVDEYDQRDRLKWEQMYPEKAEEERLSKLKEEESKEKNQEIVDDEIVME